ncbi:8771_t:CDS:2, partial [Gigaspora rosea]
GGIAVSFYSEVKVEFRFYFEMELFRFYSEMEVEFRFYFELDVHFYSEMEVELFRFWT